MEGVKIRILLTQFTSSPIVISHLANALSKKHDVSILISERLYEDRYFNDSIDVNLVRVPKSYHAVVFKTLNPFTYYSIIKKIRDINPDVIHVTWDFLWYNILSPFLKRYPFILTDEEPFQKVVTLYGKTIYKLTKPHTWKIPDAVIVHGKKGKEQLIKNGVPESKVYVVPLGVYSFYTKWMKNIREDNSILFFGAIERYKGLENLIKAAKEITYSVPEAKIVIAGKGRECQKYKGYLDKNYFETHIRYIPDEEVAMFFQRAAVVVLPYLYGSNSGIIPLAYAFEKPVVVTDVGSVAEPVEDGKTGLIVPPKDEKALAEAVIRLLRDEDLRKEMKVNIKRRAKNELSWDKIASDIVNIYDELIEEK